MSIVGKTARAAPTAVKAKAKYNNVLFRGGSVLSVCSFDVFFDKIHPLTSDDYLLCERNNKY